ncbi:MAG: transketolase [Planctomycetes bacterium]|nr:transketolase [Planctomycetota bacterium]
MSAADQPDIRETCRELRKTIIWMIHHAGSGHSGGSLSCVEILTVLYDRVMRIRPAEPGWPPRDRLILSKGHAAPALYATLARKGYFDHALLATLRTTGSPLQGHPSMRALPGVDMSSGSLGMGLSAGLGMALARDVKGENWRVFVVCGDGEMDEGQNWEALMAAAKWRVAGLVAIIDRNHVQLDGTEDEVMPLGDLSAKLSAFGWNVMACDGHDPDELEKTISAAAAQAGPCAVVAATVKGKGVSFMEGRSAWHGKPIDAQAFQTAMAELEGAKS